MRPKPSLGLAVVIFLVYSVVWIGGAYLAQPDGADFRNAFDDISNSRYLVIGLAGGTAFGLIVAAALGWWKEILHDDRPVTGWLRWMPAIVLAGILVSTDFGGIGDVDGDLLLWIAAASVLVGVSEELTFRGLTVVALRRTPVPEFQVWLISTGLFGLVHLPNVVLGAELGPAVANVVLAFFGGTLFYVIRRATGSLLPAMALHGVWDFTLFASGDGFLPILRVPLMIGLFVAFWLSRAHAFSTPRQGDRTVTASS